MTAFLGVFFAISALGSLCCLCAVAAEDLPPLLGTTALVLTLAALGVAILH